MKLSRAVYKKLLSEDDKLSIAANLTSMLWSEEITEFQEEWKPNFEKIFTRLSLNYLNPRAMNCFIFYDIQDNKIRVQVAKYLLQKGCQRIQKSVYLANISKTIYNHITSTINELQEVLSEEDSIFIVPVGEYHLSEMYMVGKDVNMNFSRSNEYVIFI